MHKGIKVRNPFGAMKVQSEMLKASLNYGTVRHASGNTSYLPVRITGRYVNHSGYAISRSLFLNHAALQELGHTEICQGRRRVSTTSSPAGSLS
jgi:hypothetical protein